MEETRNLAVPSDTSRIGETPRGGDDGPTRRAYYSPRLACLGEIDSWLEVLGPAQANYNGVPGG